MTRYYVYDVFTEKVFGGNKLAVFPDATALPEGKLQLIAREFNFSEVTFVYPPADPAHSAEVRIFTPTMEVPFAGHPVIGTAIALHDLHGWTEQQLELGVGTLPCTIEHGAARFTTSVPLEILSRPDPALVARCLSLPSVVGQPVQATLGLPFVLAEVTDRAALAAIKPDLTAVREGATLHPAGLDFAIFAYVRTGNRIDARMFAPLDNINEDPATGSASATLCAYLAAGNPLTLDIHQGEDMGRPSHIHAATGGTSVTIGGKAVKVMEGQLVL